MDLCIFDFDRQDYLDIQHLCYTPVCSLEVSYDNLEDKSRLLNYLSLLYIVKMVRKEMDCMDFLLGLGQLALIKK